MDDRDRTLRRVIETHSRRRSELIPMLQSVHSAERFISKEAVRLIADHLRISESEVYGVASFYAQFNFEEPAEHEIRVCLGTACHVRGAQKIVDTLETELGIEAGGITEDRRFSLQTVNCVGACALGPVLVVDGEYHGQMTPDRAGKAVRYQIGKAKAKHG
jgi:NADH-quinone oxidoreductase subunit E